MFKDLSYSNWQKIILSPYALLTITYLCWAGNSVFARGAAETLPPMNLSFWRWLIALLVLLPLGLKPAWRQRSVYLKHWKLMIVLSLFGIVGFNSLIYHSVQYTTAIHVALITSAVPAGSVVVSWLLYREKISLITSMGMVLAFMGVIFIVTHGDLRAILEFQFDRGDLLALVAVVSWSIYSVNLRAVPKELKSIGLLFVLTAIGFCFFIPLYLQEVFLQGRIGTPSFGNIAGIIYLGIFASVFAFSLFNRCVDEIGANRANMFNYVLPLFTGALAIITLGEHVEWFHGAAIILIFCGIYITQRGHSKAVFDRV